MFKLTTAAFALLTASTQAVSVTTQGPDNCPLHSDICPDLKNANFCNRFTDYCIWNEGLKTCVVKQAGACASPNGNWICPELKIANFCNRFTDFCTWNAGTGTCQKK